jgi:S-formylglutathione hydrolase FrmB
MLRTSFRPRPLSLPATALALLVLCAGTLVAQDPPRRRPARQKPPEFQGTVKFEELESKLLGRKIRHLVYLPKGYDEAANKSRRYPTLYFLHGLWESAERWDGRGGSEMIDAAIRRGDLPPLVAVVPDGGGSFFMDGLEGKEPYARFFIEELLPHVDGAYRTQARRESRAIAGASMGGAGALRFAFHHGDLFTAVAAHSAAILPKDLSAASPRTKRTMGFVSQRFGDVFGDPIDLKAYRAANPLTVAEDVKIDPRLRIWFDCGEDDDYEFDDGARALHDALTAKSVPHEHRILPGDHGWEYIRAATPASFKFVGDALKAADGAGGSATSRPATRPAEAGKPAAPKKD